MIPDEGESSGPGAGYESFDSPGLNVDVEDLAGYYFEMLKVQMDATGPATMELMPIPQMIREGLQNHTDAGVLPEGLYAARILQSRYSDFKHFFADVLEGVRNVGAAAAVIGEVYENADSESAAGLGDVSFAFGDVSAKPAGFRKCETYFEAEQRAREQSGEMSMSAMGDDSMARVSYTPVGGTFYSYPDGSSKYIGYRTTGPGSTVKTTTIYAPGGKVISAVTEETSSSDGSTTVKTTTTRGDGGGSSSTTTTTDPSGRVTVTSETPGPDGKPVTRTVTVDPGDHSDEGTQGPVEEAEKELDSYGTDNYVADRGRGY